MSFRKSGAGRVRAFPPLSALILLACTGTAPLTHSSVAEVVVPPPASATAQTPKAEFACAPSAPEVSARVSFEVTTLRLDEPGPRLQSRASYRVRLERASAGAQRMQVVLDALLSDTAAVAESAWRIALDRGWVEMRKPFLLELTRGGWCFAAIAGCGDEEQQEVARAIAETARLLDLPELVSQLDGKTSDGSLTLTLPAEVVKRFNLGQSEIARVEAQAHQERAGLPALFRVEPSANEEMGQQRVTGKLAVDQACQLTLLQAELTRSDTAGSNAELAGTHRFTWHFETSKSATSHD